MRKRFFIEHNDQHQRYETDRYINVKYPIPAERVGNISAEQRTEYAGGAEDGPHQPCHLPPFLHGKNIINNRERNRHQRPAADPLDRPVNAELHNASRHPAQD
ncbi:hypothetical protein D3C73_1220990 [compost metagenome]